MQYIINHDQFSHSSKLWAWNAVLWFGRGQTQLSMPQASRWIKQVRISFCQSVLSSIMVMISRADAACEVSWVGRKGGKTERVNHQIKYTLCCRLRASRLSASSESLRLPAALITKSVSSCSCSLINSALSDSLSARASFSVYKSGKNSIQCVNLCGQTVLGRCKGRKLSKYLVAHTNTLSRYLIGQLRGPSPWVLTNKKKECWPINWS